jgi:hypothetical protein
VASGGAVSFTANVTGPGNLPTGTVNFFLNGSDYGSGNLVSGTATLNTSVPYAGVYSLTAIYSGDAQHNSSTSAGVTQVVTGSANFAVAGQTSLLYHPVSVTVVLQ